MGKLTYEIEWNYQLNGWTNQDTPIIHLKNGKHLSLFITNQRYTWLRIWLFWAPSKLDKCSHAPTALKKLSCLIVLFFNVIVMVIVEVKRWGALICRFHGILLFITAKYLEKTSSWQELISGLFLKPGCLQNWRKKFFDFSLTFHWPDPEIPCLSLQD